ncbi:hypothetical protein GCM10009591_12990 [Brachybacterium tyrofermentans]
MLVTVLTLAAPPAELCGRLRVDPPMTWHNGLDRAPDWRRIMTKTYTVPPPPPHNEGKTVAAYTLNFGVVLGALFIGLGMVLPMVLLVWIGTGVIAVSIIAGIVLSLAGFGQPRRRASEAEAR